ncbi:MAG: hypothetical protein ACK5XN_35105 [Bacteroidota bacterium]
MKKGLVFRALSFTAEKVVGTFALLRNFFEKVGDAKQATVERKRKQQQINQEVSGSTYTPSQVTLDELRREEQDVFGVKNLVESLPPRMPQQFYFDKLIETLAALGRTQQVFEEGKIYVFKYIATSKGWYDVFPVAIMVDVQGRGLRGYNYHWEKYMNYIQNPYRNYNYARFESQFYEIKPHELKYVLQIPIFLPIYNR